MAVDNGYTYTDIGDGTCYITAYDKAVSSHGADPVIPSTLGTASLTVLYIATDAFKSLGLSSVTLNNVVDLDDFAFRLNAGLTVNLNADVTTARTASHLSGPFEDCSIGSNLNIGTSVTTIPNYMFAEAGVSGNLTFGSPFVLIDDRAFWRNNIISVTLDTALELDDNAFAENAGLTVNLNANVTTVSVASHLSGPFEDCSIGSNLNIGTSVTTIPNYMFAEAGVSGNLTFGSPFVLIDDRAFWRNNIISVTLDTALELDDNAFAENAGLTVNLNANVTTVSVASHLSGPFEDCGVSGNLTIGTSVTTISKFLFADAELTIVTLGANITTVGNSAFRGNLNLADFYVYNDSTSFGLNVLDACMTGAPPKGTIYGNAGSTAYTLYLSYSTYYDFSGMAPFDLEIVGTSRKDEIKKNTLRVVKGIGNKSSLSLTFNCQANDWMPDLGQDIKYYEDGSLLFGGVIKSLNVTRQEPRRDSSCYLNVNVTSDGYESICARRTVTLFFENKTAGYIFEYLVDNVLNDPSNDENIAKGDITAGNTFNEYSAICVNVKDIFDDIAEQSGVQWYIDDTKTISFVQEASISTGEHTIDSTGSFTDYQILSVTKSLSNYANKVFVKGQTDEVYTSSTDTAEITNRISIEGSAYTSGVYGKVIEAKDIISVTALSTIADNELKKYSFSPYSLQVKSYTSSWTVGTKIQVHLPEFGIDANQEYLINQLMIYREATNIFAYEMEMIRRNSADFSSQSEDKGKEYFKKAFKFTQTSSNGYKKGETGVIQNIQEESTSNYTITAETTVISTDFTLLTENDLQINFSVVCEVTAATTITSQTYIIKDGVTSSGTFQPTITISSKGTLHYSAFFNSVTSESTSVYVTLNTDGNTVSIETAEATLNLLALPQFLSE